MATYGQIAELAGLPRQARQVGYALSALPDDPAYDDVPWHRVINAKGQVSIRFDPSCAQNQYKLLEKENIAIDEQGKIDLTKYRWKK